MNDEPCAPLPPSLPLLLSLSIGFCRYLPNPVSRSLSIYLSLSPPSSSPCTALSLSLSKSFKRTPLCPLHHQGREIATAMTLCVCARVRVRVRVSTCVLQQKVCACGPEDDASREDLAFFLQISLHRHYNPAHSAVRNQTCTYTHYDVPPPTFTSANMCTRTYTYTQTQTRAGPRL